nr:ComEC/Rec2 family competence protein [Thermoflexibacter sp.]
NWIFLSITLFCLWFYAFITGLSPSVLRAVIMFSMLALANTFQRNTNIYNTIAFSAFLILSYDPYLLFSVSFQLSYLAVLGIIYFYPKLYGMWHIEDTFPTMPLWLFKPINFIWSVTCVSFAAQIGTFPVGLYYFHQFPVYFPLSNLVVIPLATIIFSGGLLIIILAWIPFVGQSIGWFIERIVWFQNEMLFLIEHLPKSVINGIDISLVENWLIYISIILVAMLFAFRKLSYLVGAFVCIFVIFVVQMQEYIEQRNQSLLYIFNSGKKLNINLLEGVSNTLIADSSLLYNDSQIRNLFYNYWANKGVAPEQVKYLNINDLGDSNFLPIYQEEGLILFIYKGKSILWLKTKIANHLPSADYLLISNNAVRNLEKLDFSKFKEIIVDASNSYYNSQKLSLQAQKLGINLYAIHEKGAFIRNW